ncbi:MAG: PBSX family phage terminase large subunit [Firmicutes bacterium]|nr:PBSX family phage terminase large subunit [Bacillota bacterium]
MASFKWGLFSPKGLQSIDESTARLNIWEGAVRSSKTICSIVRWLEYIKDGPPGDYLMTGKTERTLKRNILDPLEQIVGNKRFRYNRGMGEAYLAGRRIYVAGAADERAEGKIRGMTLAGAYGDELTLWPESFFKMLLSRLSVPGAKFFGTTNPDSPYHWLQAEYLKKEGLDLRSWHFMLEDNPNLDPVYVGALKKEYAGLWYKRFILGLWVLAEGAIYDMWDEDVHLIECPAKHQEYGVAIDYATATVMTFGLYGITGNKVYLIREYYYDAKKKGRQKTDSEFAGDFKVFLGDIVPRNIYLDPSATSFKAELRKAGYNQVKDADNDVLNGIRLVATFLNTGRFFVDRSCQETAKEFASYVWDPKAQERGEDKPLKQNDHAMDRNRYFIFTRFGKPQARATTARRGMR